MKHVGWYYDAREPTIGKYWDGTSFSRTKQLVDVGLEDLYDVYTDQKIPSWERPSGAVQIHQEWKKNELRAKSCEAMAALAERTAAKESGAEPRRLTRSRKRNDGGIGCLVVGAIALAIVLISSCQGTSAPEAKSESSAKSFCEQEIQRVAAEILELHGAFQFKHLGVGSLRNEYKVTSVINVEGLASGNRQSRWTCRLNWNEGRGGWDVLDVYQQR